MSACARVRACVSITGCAVGIARRRVGVGGWAAARAGKPPFEREKEHVRRHVGERRDAEPVTRVRRVY